MPTCKNCRTVLTGNYCQHCGQKASVRRIEFSWLLHELTHAIWHIEKGFLYNIRELYRRPGFAIADYIEGKRKSFFNPLAYLLILFAIQYFIINNFQVSFYDPVQDKGLDAAWAERLQTYDLTQQRLFNHYYLYLLMYIPVSALIFFGILRWMHVRYNYAECIVVAALSTAQVVVLQSIGLLFASLIDRTAFTRTQDVVVALSFLPMYFFQSFQLGKAGSKKEKRIIVSLIAMSLLFGWAFGLLYVMNWMLPLLF